MTFLIGLRGFEPPTSPTPRERATSLRHSPTSRKGNVNGEKFTTGRDTAPLFCHPSASLGMTKRGDGSLLLDSDGNFVLLCRHSGPIAQLGERNTGSVEVSGSIPLGSIRLAPSGLRSWLATSRRGECPERPKGVEGLLTSPYT